MTVVLFDDPHAFAAAARPLYVRDPVRHTIALTVLHGMTDRAQPAAALATVQDGDGAVVGALVCSPGHPPLVSGVAPEHAAAVVTALADAGFRASGCRGPLAEAQAYAAAHVTRHGGTVRTDRSLRLFALDDLVAPVGVPGSARPAVPGDAGLLVEWRRGFVAEAAPPGDHVPSQDQLALALARPDSGELLWTVDGTAVSQATARSPVAAMSRIGPVFTPVMHRGHGYAAAATAAAVRWAQDAGAEQVVLFTDLANPTTNRLYPRLGFRPVMDAVDLEFDG